MPREPEPILASTETKRQHYVPRFLLEQFASEGAIQRLDLDSGQVVGMSLVDAAIQRRFYDVDSPSRLSAESWLSQVVEGPAAPLLRRLADDPESLTSFNQVEQLTVARFMAAQRFRTPSLRNLIERTNANLEQQIAEALRGPLGDQVTPETLRDYVDMSAVDPPPGVERGTDVTLSVLGQVQGYAQMLLVRKWTIGRRPTGNIFFTSDEGVGAYLTPVRPFWSGVAFWEYSYYFPLSPDVLLRVAGEDYSSNVNLSELDHFGPRIHRDLSQWEASFARHVMSASATQYLFGNGPYIDRAASAQYFARFDSLQTEVATRYQGYDPRPPRNPELERLLRSKG